MGRRGGTNGPKAVVMVSIDATVSYPLSKAEPLVGVSQLPACLAFLTYKTNHLVIVKINWANQAEPVAMPGIGQTL